MSFLPKIEEPKYQRALACVGLYLLKNAATKYSEALPIVVCDGVPADVLGRPAIAFRADAPDPNHVMYITDGATWDAVEPDAAEAAIADALSYFTTDTINGALDGLATQIGGLTDATFTFSEENVLATDDALYAALEKLDLKWGDLASTATGEGASLVGVENASGWLDAATEQEAANEEIAAAIGGTDSVTRTPTAAGGAGNTITADDPIFDMIDALDQRLDQDLLTTSGPTFDSIDVTNDATIGGSLRLTGDLWVEGDRFKGDLEQMDLEANYFNQNTNYRTAVAQRSGITRNYLPTATVDTTLAAGVITAGVAATSDMTITTAGAATFAPGDLVQLSECEDEENRGYAEVVTHAANLLTLAGQLTPCQEDFTLRQLTAHVGDVGIHITKVTLSVDRCGADGRTEHGQGDTVPLAYSDFVTVDDLDTTGIVHNYTEDNVVTDDDPIFTSIDDLDMAIGDLWSVAAGEGASLIGVENAGGWLDAAVQVEAAIAEIGAAIGGTDSVTRTYTDDNVVVDDEDIVSSIDKLDQALGKMIWTMPVLGTWAVDGDGAVTNGGGSAGAALADLAVTNAAAAYACGYDHDTTTYDDIATEGGVLTHFAANFQILPDAASEAAGDGCIFGADLPFCEVGFNMTGGGGQLATWGGDGGKWRYSTGEGTWADLPAGTFYDNTDTTVPTTGLRAFQQTGVLTFYPPADWATATYNGQVAYWLKYEITAAQLTQSPILNAQEHDIITQIDVFTAPHKGVISTVRLEDGAATLHTAADVKFFLMNYTTSARTALLTFAQDKRRDRWTGLTLAVAEGDVVGVVVVQEDGTNEVTNAVLELGVAYSD